MLLVPALLVAAYCLGSIATAVIVCRLCGLADPRGVGSGNPGATNVLRLGSKKAAGMTLLGDVGKGILPVVVAQSLGLQAPVTTAVGLAAFLGHLYPVFYRFQGGKGVATFIGVSLALEPWLGLAFAASWLVVAMVTRYSSLAALVATAVTPVAAWWLGAPPAALAMFALMAALIYWRHGRNISALLAGTEKKIGQKA
ncbi:MAG: glycerol-3-phosphate 1-O-acyltransferase PlsY [Gammaproteobacteria bacterium]